MNPDEVREARAALGMTQAQLSDALELEAPWGKDTVRAWESGKRPISGPARVALRFMLRDLARKRPRRTLTIAA